MTMRREVLTVTHSKTITARRSNSPQLCGAFYPLLAHLFWFLQPETLLFSVSFSSSFFFQLQRTDIFRKNKKSQNTLTVMSGSHSSCEHTAVHLTADSQVFPSGAGEDQPELKGEWISYLQSSSDRNHGTERMLMQLSIC